MENAVIGIGARSRRTRPWASSAFRHRARRRASKSEALASKYFSSDPWKSRGPDEVGEHRDAKCTRPRGVGEGVRRDLHGHRARSHHRGAQPASLHDGRLGRRPGRQGSDDAVCSVRLEHGIEEVRRRGLAVGDVTPRRSRARRCGGAGGDGRQAARCWRTRPAAPSTSTTRSHTTRRARGPACGANSWPSARRRGRSRQRADRRRGCRARPSDVDPVRSPRFEHVDVVES